MTRSDHPAPGHGWQATPGQPIPRAARQPAANGLLLVMLAAGLVLARCPSSRGCWGRR